MQSFVAWLLAADPRGIGGLRPIGAVVLLLLRAASQWLLCWWIARRATARAKAWRSSRERAVIEQNEHLVQGVLGVMMQLHALSSRLPQGDGTRAALVAALAAADRVLTCSERGNPGIESYPQGSDLAHALALAAEGLTNAQSPPVEVTTTGGTRRLREAVFVESYRIAREAIANAVQHAHASKVSVLVAYRKAELRVRVRDDGCGLAARHDDARQAGRGLAEMQRRSARLRGSLSVVSIAGSGTDVEFRLDLERTGASDGAGWKCARLLAPLRRPRDSLA